MSDQELRLALFESYRDEMDALDVDFRRPRDLAVDDPRRQQVAEILAKYGDPPPAAPSPPGYRGSVPIDWDGSLESVSTCLQWALSTHSADERFVPEGGIGLSNLRPVIDFARCALQYLGVPDVPTGAPPMTVPDAVKGIEALLRFVLKKIEDKWERSLRTGIKGVGQKPEIKKNARRGTSQIDVDRLVVGYLEENRELIDAAAAGEPGALKMAKRILGRNAIARTLKIRSPSMVGNCSRWRETANLVGLLIGQRSIATRPRTKTGFEKALEEKAETSKADGGVIDKAIVRETESRIRGRLSSEKQREAADQIIARLQSGSISPDTALDLAELTADQHKDSRSNKTY